jgi:hypothetical protein
MDPAALAPEAHSTPVSAMRMGSERGSSFMERCLLEFAVVARRTLGATAEGNLYRS